MNVILDENLSFRATAKLSFLISLFLLFKPAGRIDSDLSAGLFFVFYICPIDRTREKPDGDYPSSGFPLRKYRKKSVFKGLSSQNFSLLS